MITVTDVKKSFGPVRALEGVTLSIAAGERVAFVGSNASGKTTLLRALMGLVRVEGRVEVDGVDVALRPEIAIRTMAYIPQIAPPVEAPVAELVRALVSLRQRAEGDVARAAERLGFSLEPLLRERFRDLSGGMKQKVLAALALSTEAPVLVCDEPTANLDAATRDRFFEAVAERPQASVLVLCSHRLDEVKTLVERVVELRDGRVRQDVPVALLEQGGPLGALEVQS